MGPLSGIDRIIKTFTGGHCTAWAMSRSRPASSTLITATKHKHTCLQSTAHHQTQLLATSALLTTCHLTYAGLFMSLLYTSYMPVSGPLRTAIKHMYADLSLLLTAINHIQSCLTPTGLWVCCGLNLQPTVNYRKPHTGLLKIHY